MRCLICGVEIENDDYHEDGEYCEECLYAQAEFADTLSALDKSYPREERSDEADK